MRMLAYGVAADAVDEYIKIGGTTTLECLRRFCKGIIRLYEQMYLRAPTQACTGSGKIVLKHGKVNLPRGIREPPQLFLKQLHLMIYESDMPFFGCLGTLNDINVLDRSPVFDDVEQGNAPRVNFFVNQRP